MSLEIRGLHIDPARRQLNYKTVINILQKISGYHINTLHIHLTDDQGIAFSSKTLNYSGGWTKKELFMIFNCAKSLGIQIIPEIDIPGHSYSLVSLIENQKYDYKDNMGIITEGLLKLEHIDKILSIFQELIDLFDLQYIHMGGDETRGGKKEYFQTIVNKVCDWAKERNLRVIAWEDILAKITDLPENLYIQKWKHRTYPPIAKNLEKLGNSRVIFSNNYYLDTCIDPLTSYRLKIPENALGCIACCWGELIGEENIYQTVFPTVQLFGIKWINYKTVNNPLFILRDIISDGIESQEWRRKQWKGFILKQGEDIHPRSTLSIKKSTVLNREHDMYPLISIFLIDFGIDLYNYLIHNNIPKRKDLYNKKLVESGVTIQTVEKLWDTKLDVDNKKSLIRRLRKETEPEEQLLYKNGFRMIFREVLRTKV
jgi:hypothetical protein